MSFLVARMAKMKAENLIGIGNHNQRKFKRHSNSDIDIKKSHLNYDLVSKTESYQRDIMDFINGKKSSKRAVRKDAVLVNEWIITSDQDFFRFKSEKEIKDFFEKSMDYFAENFGEENIRYAQVHLDETTPHMHLGIVPFDSDKKLSAKRVFNKETLIKIQDELPACLGEHGFDLERGKKGSERKNLSVPEYKEMTLEIKRAEKEVKKKEQKARSMELEIARKKVEIQRLDSKISKKKKVLKEIEERYQKLVEKVSEFKKTFLNPDSFENRFRWLVKGVQNIDSNLDDEVMLDIESDGYQIEFYEKENIDNYLNEFENDDELEL